MTQKNKISMVLYDSTEYWNGNEENFKEGYEEYKEINDIEDINNDGLIDFIYESRDIDFEDFLTNIQYSKYANMKYIISGTLGLWDGKHDIHIKVCKTLKEAVNKCIGTANDVIVKQENGGVKVEAMHHDGTNVFMIRLISYLGENTKNLEERTEVEPWMYKNIYDYIF